MNKLTQLAVIALGFTALQATAQNYPTKPIRLIVPFSSGGPTDTHSRWAGNYIASALGQQVLPEGLSIIPRIFIRVDFPQPEGPMMETNSPALISMLTSLSAVVSTSSVR